MLGVTVFKTASGGSVSENPRVVTADSDAPKNADVFGIWEMTGAGTFTSFADNTGNPNYTNALAVAGNVAGRAGIASNVFQPNKIIGGTTTLTFTSSGTSLKGVAGFYTTGGRILGLDKGGTAATGIGTAVTSTSTGVLTQPSEVGFFILFFDGAATISAEPAGWTNIFGAGGFMSTSGTVVNLAIYYQQVSSTAALAPTATLSTSVNWSTIVGTYRWEDFGSRYMPVKIASNRVGPPVLRRAFRLPVASSSTVITSNAFSQTVSVSQSQAYAGAAGTSVIRNWTQGQALSIKRAIAASKSWTQAQAISVKKSGSNTLVWTQGQTSSLSNAITISKAWTQGQALSTAKAITTSKSWTQGQAFTVSVVRSYLKTLSFVQGQAFTLARSMSAIKSWAQGQSNVFAKASAKVTSWTQGQIGTTKRSSAIVKGWTQGQSSLLAFQVSVFKNWTQGQSVSLKRAITHGLSWTQGQSFSLLQAAINAYFATLNFTQGQAFAVRRAIAFNLAWTQSQIVAFARLSHLTVVLQFVQAQAISISAHLGSILSSAPRLIWVDGRPAIKIGKMFYHRF